MDKTRSESVRGPRGELSAFDAHDEAMGLPTTEVVSRLVDYLGATTVAAIAGVGETRAVKQWMSKGGREPQRQHALRFALQLAAMIASKADADVVQAWFSGSNPHLGDQVPALMLRNRPLDEIQGPLMTAARSFADRA
jgi:hypothetical protein